MKAKLANVNIFGQKSTVKRTVIIYIGDIVTTVDKEGKISCFPSSETKYIDLAAIAPKGSLHQDDISVCFWDKQKSEMHDIDLWLKEWNIDIDSIKWNNKKIPNDYKIVNLNAEFFAIISRIERISAEMEFGIDTIAISRILGIIKESDIDFKLDVIKFLSSSD